MERGEWQPTDTAPRDGTRIIGWFADRPIVVWWRSGPPTTKYRAKNERVWFWSSGYFRHPEPDCWQPVPNAPEGRVATLRAETSGEGHERRSAADKGHVRTHVEGRF